MKLSPIFKKCRDAAYSLAGASAIFYIVATPYNAHRIRENHVDVKDFPNTEVAAAVFTGGYNRVKVGLDIYAKDSVGALHISGAQSPMDSILGKAGYTQDDFSGDIETDNAQNTQENAEAIAAWIIDENLEDIVLITSSYHAQRAKRELKKALGAEAGGVNIMCHIVGNHLDFPNYYLYPKDIYRGSYGPGLLIIKDWAQEQVKTLLPSDP